MAIKRANVEDYGIIATKGYTFNNPSNSAKQFTITFDILDRNIGATKIFDEKGTPESNKASIGEFFQFGNSIPVGTADALNSYYNKESNGGDLDWSDAKNTPCPEGWRMLTKDETSLLASAMEVADPYFSDQSDADIDAAIAFESKVKIPNSGQYKIDGTTVEERTANEPIHYLTTAKYFWAGQKTLNKDGTAKTSKRGFNLAASFEYNSFPLGNASAEMNTARPIRCVK